MAPCVSLWYGFWMFTETYRPTKVSDVILTSDVQQLITNIKSKKTIPNMIFYGGAGLGKTTLARALCHDMQCEPFELNTSLDNSIETVRRKVMNFATTLSLTQSQKVIILDEADNMSVQMQKALRGVIETVSNNCRFIFTANFVDRILEPIQSRCTLVKFNIDGDKKIETAVVSHCVTILKKEKIKFKQNDLVQHIQHHLPDIRRCVGELEVNSNGGSFAFHGNTKGVSKTASTGDLTIDMGKCKKLILRPHRSQNWMMQVFKDKKKNRKSSGVSDRKVAELKLDDYYNEIYADEPSKEQMLESIITIEKSLSMLKGVVERMK